MSSHPQHPPPQQKSSATAKLVNTARSAVSAVRSLFAVPAQPTSTKSHSTKRRFQDLQDDEHEQFSRLAIQTLTAKLQWICGYDESRRQLEHLKMALAHPLGKSPCVIIARSSDGRLQVGNFRGQPHLIYCRLWRWPDLRDPNELRAVAHCHFPYDAQLARVCVNPTHYERHELLQYPSVMVRHLETPSAPEPLTTAMTDDEQQPPQKQQKRMMPPELRIAPMEVDLPNRIVSVPSPGSASIDSGHCSSDNYSPSFDDIVQMSTADWDYVLASITEPEKPSPPKPLTKESPAALPTESSTAIRVSNPSPTSGETVAVDYVPPVHWASIAYFELNRRVGAIYQCYNHEITVDGFTDPQPHISRFCLGQLNDAIRDPNVERTRLHIGRGIRMTYTKGQLMLRNISDASVFVQSPILNEVRRFDGNCVLKILPASELIVYDNQQFAKLLCEAVEGGFEVVFGLVRMCTIRVSFVKGWGAEYHRQEVSMTPCWIEMHMNGALKWLDDVLTMMGSPTLAVSSVS